MTMTSTTPPEGYNTMKLGFGRSVRPGMKGLAVGLFAVALIAGACGSSSHSSSSNTTRHDRLVIAGDLGVQSGRHVGRSVTGDWHALERDDPRLGQLLRPQLRQHP